MNTPDPASCADPTNTGAVALQTALTKARDDLREISAGLPAVHYQQKPLRGAIAAFELALAAPHRPAPPEIEGLDDLIRNHALAAVKVERSRRNLQNLPVARQERQDARSAILAVFASITTERDAAIIRAKRLHEEFWEVERERQQVCLAVEHHSNSSTPVSYIVRERLAETESTLATARAQAEALAGAAQVFAVQAECYDPPENDDHHRAFDSPFTVGDLRRIDNALKAYRSTHPAEPAPRPARVVSDGDVERFRERALEAIFALRHKAAATFTPEYSGALGMARTDSFAEAFQAVQKLPARVEAGRADADKRADRGQTP